MTFVLPARGTSSKRPTPRFPCTHTRTKIKQIVKIGWRFYGMTERRQRVRFLSIEAQAISAAGVFGKRSPTSSRHLRGRPSTKGILGSQPTWWFTCSGLHSHFTLCVAERSERQWIISPFALEHTRGPIKDPRL